MARNYRVKNGISFGTGVSDLSGLNCEYYQTSLGTTTLTLVGLCSTSVIRSAKYLIQLTQPSNNQVAELLTIHDGSSASILEYGNISTGNTILASFSTGITTGNMFLGVTLASAVATTIKIERVSIGI
jgi:hypothetical protein